MKLFIDTNIFLSFYHLTKDDLEELRKLVVLIDDKKVTLYLPQQVKNEFKRNRDVKLSDALSKFKHELLNNQFPQICKEYPEYMVMRSAIKQYNQSKSKLLEKLTHDIDEVRLKADHVIDDLFKKANQIDITDNLVTKAKLRYELGNPPGKKGSYGDAVNWVSLLTEVPKDSDLYFISEDSDYISSLNSDKFSPFLLEEWRNKKNGKIIFFKRLSPFFKEKFPHIKLASELEKALLIKRLSTSGCFADTRSALKKMSKFSEFTLTEVKSIVEASITNNQIFWIMGDEDINKYLRDIIKGHEDNIDPEALKTFNNYLGGEEDAEPESDAGSFISEDEIPF